MNQTVVITDAQNVEQLKNGYIYNEYRQAVRFSRIDILTFTPDGSKVIVIGV